MYGFSCGFVNDQLNLFELFLHFKSPWFGKKFPFKLVKNLDIRADP